MGMEISSSTIGWWVWKNGSKSRNLFYFGDQTHGTDHGTEVFKVVRGPCPVWMEEHLVICHLIHMGLHYIYTCHRTMQITTYRHDFTSNYLQPFMYRFRTTAAAGTTSLLSSCLARRRVGWLPGLLLRDANVNIMKDVETNGGITKRRPYR